MGCHGRPPASEGGWKHGTAGNHLNAANNRSQRRDATAGKKVLITDDPRGESFLCFALDFSKREGISDHFNIDFGGGGYAHGDRIKAASSARSRQDGDLKHNLGFRIEHFELR